MLPWDTIMDIMQGILDKLQPVFFRCIKQWLAPYFKNGQGVFVFGDNLVSSEVLGWSKTANSYYHSQHILDKPA